MTERFHYEHDGHSITIPHAKNLPVGLLRKARKLEGVDQAFTILEDLADDESLAGIDRMGLDEFEEFMQAWQKASGVQLGE